MAEIKWSSFTNGGAMQAGDQLVGLRSGDNYRFTTNPLVIWTSIAGTSQSAAVNTGYIVANASQTTITLPATFSVGDIVSIAGLGAAGWILQPNAGDSVQTPVGAASTSITSSSAYDSITVVGVVANTTWIILSSSTTGFTIV